MEVREVRHRPTAECYTINLKKSNSTWETVPSMNHPRGKFTIEVIKSKAYAIGGESDLGLDFTGPTVEVFTPGGEWEISTEMQMPSYRHLHCSTTLGNRIVVIGGAYGGTDYSPSVIQYDMDHPAKGWTHLNQHPLRSAAPRLPAGVLPGSEGNLRRRRIQQRTHSCGVLR